MGNPYNRINNIEDYIECLQAMEYQPWNLAVTEGLIDGFSKIDKFGLNPLITSTSDPEDCWEGGGLYNYSTTADIVSVASTDASDTQVLRVQGLDGTGAEVTQDVTLSGTTRVALSTPLYRVYRMENMGSTDFAGTVFCYTGTGAVPTLGDSNVRAVIDDGNNQTLMSLYTVPLGKVAFLFRGEVGMEISGGAALGADYAQVHYRSRRLGEVFKTKKVITLQATGNSLYKDVRSFPDVIPALTDISILIQEVSASMGIWSTFDLLLVDEDKLPDSYLTAIGQPTSL